MIGHTVYCLDVDERKIATLTKGQIPVYEPYLEELLEQARQNLHFTTSYESALTTADVIFVAVGTPPLQSGAPNLEYLSSAARAIGANLNSGFSGS